MKGWAVSWSGKDGGRGGVTGEGEKGSILGTEEEETFGKGTRPTKLTFLDDLAANWISLMREGGLAAG